MRPTPIYMDSYAPPAPAAAPSQSKNASQFNQVLTDVRQLQNELKLEKQNKLAVSPEIVALMNELKIENHDRITVSPHIVERMKELEIQKPDKLVESPEIAALIAQARQP